MIYQNLLNEIIKYDNTYKILDDKILNLWTYIFETNKEIIHLCRTDRVGPQSREKQQESIEECHKSLTSPPCDASLIQRSQKTIKLMARPMGGTTL